MNRFVDENDKTKIDLGDGDFVEVPAKLSFGFISNFENLQNSKEKTVDFLTKVILTWNLKDAEGKEVPVTKENIIKLDVNTVVQIMKVITPMITAEKKELVALG